MTTNKPPIAAWAPSTALHKLESRHNNAPCILTDGPAEFNDAALVRLSDYEALQADRDQQYDMKVKTREQRDAVTAKLNALQAECERLDRESQNLSDQLGRCDRERLKALAECEKLRRDAERYRFLCDGNGYFLEHEMLCGFENEKAEADAAIAAAMEGGSHE